MKRILKAQVVLFLVLSALLTAAPAALSIPAVSVSAAAYKSEFVKKNGKWYYYDSKGNLCKGWYRTSGGAIYYFGSDGAARPGLQKIDNKYYFFSQKGKAFTGWVTVANKKCYFDLKTGTRYAGYHKIDGKMYYFDKNDGHVFTGWIAIGNNRYFFSTTGAAKTGILTLGGNQYYFDEKGKMIRNKTVTVNKKTYFFGPSGAMQKGRVKIGQYWYAFDQKTGVMVKSGWYKENGKYYYAGSSGKLATGAVKFGKKTRYFDPSTCVMSVGWLKYKGGLYFFTSAGYRVEGKLTTPSGKMYYFSSNGRLYQNKVIKTSEGKYFALSNGVLATGWLQYKSHKYYFNSKGIMQNGWKKISGNYYYFSPSTGAMAVSKWIDETHYVDSDGKYLPGYSKQNFIWPLSSNWNNVTSKFGYRESPGGIGSTNHKGIDISAPTGTPIYAIASGTVTLVQTPSQSGGGGNYTVIDHGNNISSGYMHQSKFAAGIKVGVKVKKGQLIGYVGSTGNSTGPHLHLEISINGVKKDPLNYIKIP